MPDVKVNSCGSDEIKKRNARGIRNSVCHLIERQTYDEKRYTIVSDSKFCAVARPIASYLALTAVQLSNELVDWQSIREEYKKVYLAFRNYLTRIEDDAHTDFRKRQTSPNSHAGKADVDLAVLRIEESLQR